MFKNLLQLLTIGTGSVDWPQKTRLFPQLRRHSFQNAVSNKNEMTDNVQNVNNFIKYLLAINTIFCKFQIDTHINHMKNRIT
jgi:hypothetical protein